jgi:DNA helicase-2/ATP-dependent DNA helicase PcrA
MDRLLKDLNEAQLEAVTTTEGPLLVIAGAGSGKTRVLTRRLAHILRQRLAQPHQVLAVTFTNKAAGEMRQRVRELLGTDVPGLTVSTFHSFCARLLRREAEAIGYTTDYTIFDADDARTLVKNCINDLGLSGSQFSPRAQIRKISDAKNKLITAEEFASRASGYFESTTAKIYQRYEQRLRQCNAMDFDDLLVNAVILLREKHDIGQHYRQRFKYLMVDEYQDTNHVQYLLLKNLVGEHNNICVVGDEDQSIYGWRGADIRNILDFEKDFAGAKIIKLEQNYRSTAIILKAAGAVIRNNQARKDKTLWTAIDGGDNVNYMLVDSADEEASEVVAKIDSMREAIPVNQMVILYRTNAQSRAFEEHLRRRAIPYQIIGGVGFYERREIKDILAYLRLLVNPRDDVSFARVVNFPKRGIGAKTLQDIALLARETDQSWYQIATRWQEYDLLSSRGKRLKPFVDLIEKYREQADSRPTDLLVQDLIDELNILQEYRQEDEIQGQTRVENVEAFIEGVAEYSAQNPEATLVDYLSEISLYTDLESYEEDEPAIPLMTIHSAKGLEYDIVFLVGLEEGLFPLARATEDPSQLEEERRLFYVAATRARKRLVLSSATTRHRFGVVESIPSRFVEELPIDLVERIDRRTGRTAVSNIPGESISFFGPRQQPRRSPRQEQPKGVHYEFEGEEQFRPGRIVQHPTFGRGKIVNTEGFGESLRMEIMFTGAGLKKIMAKYAKLRVVG